MENPTGRCEHCESTLRYRLIHNGFNDTAYAYCEACSFTVLLSCWDKAAKRVSFRIHRRITPDLEVFLKPCPCGGAFRASADPKCPSCARSLSVTKATAYIEKNAPGTAEGWRWDQSWSGIYSIVINENCVNDSWDDEAIDRLLPLIDSRV